MNRSIVLMLLVAAVVQPALAQPAPVEPGPAGPEPKPAAASPDDLSKAADAASELAGVPAAAPGPKASSDDIDLSSLGLDPSANAFDDKLNIYGYLDLAYKAQHWFRPPLIQQQDERGFSTGNINLYLAKNASPKARLLVEVQFSFLPNGAPNADGSFASTNVIDPANDNIATRWGSIVIQRAYLEYDLAEHLTLRAGHWLTPYGIWNTDHGSPVILPTSRPYIIDQELFPQHQTGFELFGSHTASNFKLNYHATMSNGRGDTEAQLDLDKKLAFGGRLELETPWGVKAGASYYRGRYTGLPAAPGAAPPTYREEAYGGDAQFDHAGLHLQSELSVRVRHYGTAEAAAIATSEPTSSADPSDFGFYVLAGYRFDMLWNVMPFGYYQYYRAADHALYETINSQTAGLNFRPSGGMVFKLQGTRGRVGDGGGLLAGILIYQFAAQAAWVF